MFAPSANAAFQFLPQNDANAAGSWSSIRLTQTPTTVQEFGACEMYQFFVHTSVPRSGGSPNYTYSRYRDGSGQGCYGLWPGINPIKYANVDFQAASTWMESPTIRVFKFKNGQVLKAQRVWWPQYGAMQKGIRWINEYSSESFLVSTFQWYR
jgi:hypothetical protein